MTTEYVVQMVPMLVIAGVLVAWLAQIPATTRGFGFLPDMALGLAGSLGAGALVGTGMGGDAGMIVMFWVGIVGASVAIGSQRRLWRSTAVRP